MSNVNQDNPRKWKHPVLGWLQEIFGFIKRIGAEELVGMVPIIHRFEASSSLADGKDITLSWEVEHTTRLLLNDLDVTGRESTTVNPRSDTSYILCAFNDLYNEQGKQSAPIAIWLDRTPPFIHAFRCAPAFARNGEPVRLSWQVAGATALEIDGIGPVTGDSRPVIPVEDTIYVLRATSHAGITTTAHVGVEVDKTPPVITRLEVEPRLLTEVGPVRVVWDTQGAKYVEIVGFGQYPPAGEVSLPIQSDMTLRFLAVSHYQVQHSEEIELTTSKKPPVIHAFQADRPVLTDAMPAVLTWEVENAARLEIDHGVGNVTGSDSWPVHTLEDRVYTLTAWSYFGVAAQATLVLRIDRTPPQITLFQSDKAFILNDHNVELSWAVTGAHQVMLYPLGIAVDSRESYSVIVRQDTVFRLVAYNYFGYSTQAELPVRILPIPVIESLLVPGPSIEQTVNVKYDRLIPSTLPTHSIQFNTSLFSLPLPMVTLRVEAFTPPLELRAHTWMDRFINVFSNKFQAIVNDIRQLIREKMQRAE